MAPMAFLLVCLAVNSARLFVAPLLLVLVPATAEASWVTKIIGAAEHAGSRAARHGVGSLDNVAQHIRALPKSEIAPLAAQATPEGHWRFVNRAGETFTAASAEELKRVPFVLLPEVAGAGEMRLSLYLTDETAFSHRTLLKDLPRNAELRVVVGRDSYRILKRGEGTSERLFAEVRPNVVVEMADRKSFEEAVWQLARPLNKAGVRVVALEPGGPPALASSPRIEPVTKRALIDVIDPSSLIQALSAIRGQTVVMTGRIERNLVYIKPSSGPERSLIWRDLLHAAEESDVDLLVLQSSTPRQPGGRNWLWQKVEVKGLDDALQRATLSDFLNALAGSHRRLGVTAFARGSRTTLDIRPVVDLPREGAQTPLAAVFAEFIADISGNVIASAVTASMTSSERMKELDERIVPGIPSDLQIAYLALVLIGLSGAPLSRSWWRRLWPPEARAEYAQAFGYWAAAGIRAAVYLLVFMPLTAPLSAPLQVLRTIWQIISAPWRWITGQPSPSAT
jgi:hypothetical protein